jgi:hypothetical protein
MASLSPGYSRLKWPRDRGLFLCSVAGHGAKALPALVRGLHLGCPSRRSQLAGKDQLLCWTSLANGSSILHRVVLKFLTGGLLLVSQRDHLFGGILHAGGDGELKTRIAQHALPPPRRSYLRASFRRCLFLQHNMRNRRSGRENAPHTCAGPRKVGKPRNC